ncbi:hypothetical protein BGW37DRAFT_483408 [Umbelopsis sp. PMI_123]|nr:hypothetical protein BGW37DRAFT_483408 [Umbelopsis sp. PMI_123]
MRVLRYITTLAFAGALVHAAPTGYGTSTQSVSQDLDSLFQYISGQKNGATIPQQQQLQQDLTTLQSTTDTSSQDYKSAVDNFWSQLGELWVAYPYWDGWSRLISDVRQDGWNPTEHSNDANTNDYNNGNSKPNQFENDLTDLEAYLQQYDIGSLGDALIVKQAIAWLDQNEHNIATVDDFNYQISRLDDAWGRLQKNNAAWTKWSVADNDFKSIYSDALKDVPKSYLTHLYAEENSHNNGVAYEDLDGFFYNPNQHNDGLNGYEDIDAELSAILTALSKPKQVSHIDGLVDLVENINHNDSI